MSNRVPTYQWDPAIQPILLKQLVAEPLGFTIVEERLPNVFSPRDLTGLTAFFSLQRETAPSSGLFTIEIDAAAMTIPTPTNGQVFYTLDPALLLVEGDHLGEITLKQSSVVVARIPRGRTYLRVIVGRALLGV